MPSAYHVMSVSTEVCMFLGLVKWGLMDGDLFVCRLLQDGSNIILKFR